MKKLTTCFLITIASIHSVFAQNDLEIVQKTLTKDKIESHIRYLASDELKGRNTPSEGQIKAAEYIVSKLKEYGVSPLKDYPDYLQPVPMKTLIKPERINLSYDNQNFKVKDDLILLDGNTTTLEATGIYLGYGMASDFESADVKGKIVFVSAGTEGEGSPQKWFFAGREKAARAKEKGAIALIEFYNNKQLPWKLLVNYLHTDRTGLDKGEKDKEAIPHIWMYDPENVQLDYWAKGQSTSLSLEIKTGATNGFTVYNVVGVINGTDDTQKSDYVVYSAHYDHVGVGEPDEKGDSIYNGARDDVVGCASILSLAENLGKHPAKRSGMFCFFTGEEKGLLGSSWFVDHSPIEMKKIKFCFNSDNAGYNNTEVAMIMGLYRTSADVHILKGCEGFGLKAIDDPVPEQNLFDRSDNVSFARYGVPAPTFSLGLTAFDEAIQKYYHRPADQPDNLDFEYLYKFTGSYVYAARLIANDVNVPFWKEGDKYYETGVKLYK